MSEELKPCIVTDCLKLAKNRDKYCSMHRARLFRTNRLDKKSTIERIREKSSEINPITHCIEWCGYRNNEGYGRFRVNGGKILAHRAVYIETYGDIDDGICVLHHCDNPSCVNPDHLFLGTHKDNFDDAVKKGRIDPVARAKERWLKCPTLRK